MAQLKEIYLAGGCFWGTEHYFKQIRGVVETEVGFANGHLDNPSYKQVKAGDTGFAETVHIKYDPDVVGLELLGTQYRTGIYYTDPSDIQVIDKVYGAVEKAAGQPLAVEKLPLQNFFTAEEYHQDYLDKNPTGYCHLPEALFEFARKANK